MKTETKIQQSKVEAINEIRILLTKMIKSQESGLLDEFAECYSHDETMINVGTDLDEIWHGWFPFFKWMSKSIPAKTGYQINDMNTTIHISDSGDTAWYFQLLDTCFETKDEIQRIEGFRHTGVLVCINNQWKIVQSHMSVPWTPIS